METKNACLQRCTKKHTNVPSISHYHAWDVITACTYIAILVEIFVFCLLSSFPAFRFGHGDRVDDGWLPLPLLPLRLANTHSARLYGRERRWNLRFLTFVLIAAGIRVPKFGKKEIMCHRFSPLVTASVHGTSGTDYETP